MTLFDAELLRNFAIGFAAGAAALAIQAGSQHWDSIQPVIAAILPV